MSVRFARAGDADAIARLHAAAVTEGFLPSLGSRFLRLLHRRIAVSGHSFAIVDERDAVVIGVVAASENVRSLYRDFLLRDGLRAGVSALPHLVIATRRALETLRYPSRHAELPPAEILVVAVDAAARGKGIGRTLVGRAIDELTARDARRVRVVTTVSNVASLALYRAAGFATASTTEIHRGTESVVLVRPAASEVPR